MNRFNQLLPIALAGIRLELKTKTVNVECLPDLAAVSHCRLTPDLL